MLDAFTGQRWQHFIITFNIHYPSISKASGSHTTKSKVAERNLKQISQGNWIQKVR